MSTSAGTTKDAQNTPYMELLLDSTIKVPSYHTWGVSFASWLLLAGFIVFPGTFTNIKHISVRNQAVSSAEQWTLTRKLLLGVAGLCSGLGALGMIIFWIRWRHNHVAITHNVFWLGIQHGCTGIISTLVNVYTAQSGEWSIMARITVAVEGGCTIICGMLFAFYWGFLWRELKRRRSQHSNTDEEKGAEGQRPTTRVCSQVQGEDAVETGGNHHAFANTSAIFI